MTRLQDAENIKKPSVYNIPAGQNFARLMVRYFLDETQETPEKLGEITILLPTRRACRSFQDMFLQESAGKPILLPKLQPFGDVDEQDLSLSLAGTDALAEILALPPAIAPLQRHVLLAKLIAPVKNFSSSFDQALSLADALATFLDQIIIEGLEFENLAQIVPEEFADHWQITLDFLKILSEHWRIILDDLGVIEAAERRNRLMQILARHWQDTRPVNPIYAAGSTGSIPATAELLKVISKLPAGHVVLPGLDQEIDQRSWESLAPSHPQYGLKQLLEHLEIDRHHVALWPNSLHQDTARQKLCREVMRPAATAQHWVEIGQNSALCAELSNGLQGLKIYEAANQREEALLIAMTFREALEQSRKTAVLVTPDRKLARRVSGYCKRWGITVDDSAGQRLNQTETGLFLQLICEAARQNIAPQAFLELLKHNYCRIDYSDDAYRKIIQAFEIHILRGLKPQSGFIGYRKILNEISLKGNSEDYWKDIEVFLNHLEPVMTPFITMMSDKKSYKFKDLLQAHLTLAERLCQSSDLLHDNIPVWQHEAGESAASLFGELSQYAEQFDEMDGDVYARTLRHFMSGISVRPRYGTHPRLNILGQLEARLIDADLIILGGLNEGSWPPDPGHDPWMSRPMRQNFGLPDSDRSVGLAAHDFTQGFCAENVILTRSKTVDSTLCVPARWLQRLDTVVKAAGLDPKELREKDRFQWLNALDKIDDLLPPVSRPQYSPPLDKRPKKLSVTKIETWLKDPYGLYAREILRLRKLDDIEKPIDAAAKGSLLHSVLEQFSLEFKSTIPADAKAHLIDHARAHIENLGEDPTIWSFWWPRFEKICDWIIAHEKDWRSLYKARPIALECEGRLELQTARTQFTLSGKIDRIDLMGDGRCAIIDYKSGGTYSAAKMLNGTYPQLPLEALMLEGHAFAEYGITGKTTASLQYWILSGGKQAGNVQSLDADTMKIPMPELIENTRIGLENLVEAFADENVPYICLPKAHAQPLFNDYEHLERIQEWAALEDEENSDMEAA